MKLTKDQIQKAVLAGMLVLGGLYYYSFELLEPLTKKQTLAAKEIAALEPKIKDAKSKINKANAIETGDPNAAAARKAYEAMKAKIPTGEPVAWFPTKLTEFFRRQGIPKQSFRYSNQTSEETFPGYRTSSWVIELPSVDFVTLGSALADLENQEGLMQIDNLQIDAAGKEPESHRVQLIVSTLVKSEN